MKKNKYTAYGLIGLMGVSSSSVSIADQDKTIRLYGSPKSVSNEPESSITPLRLSMRKNEIPKGLWLDIEELSNLWLDMTNPNSSIIYNTEMFDDSKISFASKEKIKETIEYKILQSLSSPYLSDLINSGDYEGVITELDKLGLWKSDDENDLQNKFEYVLKKNNTIRDKVSSIMQISTTGGYNKDIAFLNENIKASVEASVVAAAAVLVVVAVAAATYVAAAVSVAAAANAIAYLSVAVNAAISVQGNVGVGGSGNCTGYCHTDIGRSSISGKMNKNYNTIQNISALHSNSYLLSKAEVDFQKKEARAIVRAALNTGLITIEPDVMDQVFSAIDRISDKSMMN